MDKNAKLEEEEIVQEIKGPAPPEEIPEEQMDDGDEEREDDDEQDITLLTLLQSPDKTKQLASLSQLNEILSLSQDTLPIPLDPMIKILISIISVNDDDFINQDLILLGYRCLVNLIEAIPSSTVHLVQQGAVKILVDKLSNVEYIDLAEQALAVLSRIAAEYPSSLIKANGLIAVLQYIDFFSIHVQRMAITIAANSCRGLASVSLAAPTPDAVSGIDAVFGAVQQVMDTLSRLLQHSDGKVVDGAVDCLARIVEWGCKQESRLESLIQSSLLQIIVSNIATTPSIALVKILCNISAASPKISLCLIQELNIISVVGGILGREGNQDYVCQVVAFASCLLPALPKQNQWDFKDIGIAEKESSESAEVIKTCMEAEKDLTDNGPTIKAQEELPETRREAARLALLKDSLNTFTSTLLPALITLHAATVNARFKKGIVECICKAVWYTAGGTVNGSLPPSPTFASIPGFAKFISDLLSERENIVLVTGGIMITSVLAGSAEYAALFGREGVFAELDRIAALTPVAPETKGGDEPDLKEIKDLLERAESLGTDDSRALMTSMRAAIEHISHKAPPVVGLNGQRYTAQELQAWASAASKRIRGQQADNTVLGEIASITAGLGKDCGTDLALLQRLALLTTRGITGFELVQSGVVAHLEEYLTLLPVPRSKTKSKHTTPVLTRVKCFLHVFLNTPAPLTHPSYYVPSAFAALVSCLSQLLSRTERFSIHSEAGNQLSRQLRLKLIPADPTSVPKSFANGITVCIHAIALFSQLEAFLLPRLVAAAAVEPDDPIHDEEEMVDVSDIIVDDDGKQIVKEQAKPPKDFYLSFSVDGHRKHPDTTIFSAVYDPARTTSVWGPTFSITYEKIEKAKKRERRKSAKVPPAALDTGLEGVLGLLRLLHSLNTRWSDFFLEEDAVFVCKNQAAMAAEGSGTLGLTDQEVQDSQATLPLSAFQNDKLTAKLVKQLDEPLVVASQVLPPWCGLIVREYSFLVPFEARLLYLQSTCFGYYRSLSRWQQQGSVARMQRQKVRILRDKLLESMVKVMELYGPSQALLEIEFFDEVGTGLGPTLEFYTDVCTLVQKRVLSLANSKGVSLWREDGSENEYINVSLGLFPRPIKFGLDPEAERIQLLLFKTLGTFVAKALADGRIIDFPFNQVFLRLLLDQDLSDQFHSKSSAQLHAIKFIDPQLHHSLMELVKNQKDVDDMCLDFTLPGYANIHLVQNGDSVKVNAANLEEYVKLVIDFTVGRGVKKQIEAFRKGMNLVFSVSDLKFFSIQELLLLFTGDDQDWSYSAIIECIKPDHGYTIESKTIQNLVLMMSNFSAQQRREFLQFISGSVRLPHGGWKAMAPLTVVCKTVEGGSKPDDYLPSVMTCVNYLKIPNYSSVDVMRERFSVAFQEGRGAFHLS